MQDKTFAKMGEQVRRRRISKKLKAEIVLALLRGESIEELSRNNKIAVHEIAQWKDSFLEGGSKGLTKQGKNNSREAELERIIGRQQMEIELLKKRRRDLDGTTRIRKSNGLRVVIIYGEVLSNASNPGCS